MTGPTPRRGIPLRSLFPVPESDPRPVPAYAGPSASRSGDIAGSLRLLAGPATDPLPKKAFTIEDGIIYLA